MESKLTVSEVKQISNGENPVFNDWYRINVYDEIGDSVLIFDMGVEKRLPNLTPERFKNIVELLINQIQK